MLRLISRFDKADKPADAASEGDNTADTMGVGQKCFILLDTSSSEYFTVALAKPDGRWLAYRRSACNFSQSEKLLPQLERLMNQHRLAPAMVSGICVVAGPGGFTSLRIGIMTADALGFAWKKPVTALAATEYDPRTGLGSRTLAKLKKAGVRSQVQPRYGRPPHITRPKR